MQSSKTTVDYSETMKQAEDMLRKDVWSTASELLVVDSYKLTVGKCIHFCRIR